MINKSIVSELFSVLDIAVMERLEDGTFKAIGSVPDWFLQFYPDAAFSQNRLRLDVKFPFLENFLIDAEGYWMAYNAQPLKSGFWSECNSAGNTFNFEATALYIKNRKVLLIESLGIAYHEKQSLIQTGRENSLNYYNLVKEIQKKEILLHCIVHDLAGQLTTINCSLELLEHQNLTTKGKKYLQIAKGQSIKQGILIQEILDAFSAEVESLEAFTFDPARAPDAIACAREVVDALLPTFTLNKMKLHLKQNIDIVRECKVVGEKSRLERVISNLVENALRHSPQKSTVTVDVEEDGDFIAIAVEDEGPGVATELSKNLFQKFSQGKKNAGRAGLGLYFCRITVERWGGTIGYSPRNEGGSRFWFRLPRPVIN